MRFQLYREQQINSDIDTTWSFFSSPMNLSKITPKNMGFKVISDLSNKYIYEGMMIEYIVSPVLYIPLKWVTRIIQVEKHSSFTDIQEKGPYKYWKHFHEFVPNENGVIIRDTIDYELPFRLLGQIANNVFVRKKLENIFNYRYQILEKHFNQKK